MVKQKSQAFPNDLEKLEFEHYWLVVWNINFIFPCIGNTHPNWRTHIFQRGGPTTNQIKPCPTCRASMMFISDFCPTFHDRENPGDIPARWVHKISRRVRHDLFRKPRWDPLGVTDPTLGVSHEVLDHWIWINERKIGGLQWGSNLSGLNMFKSFKSKFWLNAKIQKSSSHVFCPRQFLLIISVKVMTARPSQSIGRQYSHVLSSMPIMSSLQNLIFSSRWGRFLQFLHHCW